MSVQQTSSTPASSESSTTSSPQSQYLPIKIHCIRHAEAVHNLSDDLHRLPDPILTSEGEKQSLALSSPLSLESGFPPQSSIKMVISSPLKRTLKTASLGFQIALESPNNTTGGQIIAVPELQETKAVPCDIGTNLPQLERYCYGNKISVDLSRVGKDWNNKFPESRFSQDPKKLTVRAQDARKILWELVESLVHTPVPGTGTAINAQPRLRGSDGKEWPEVVVVCHGGFLHYLIEDWADKVKRVARKWDNCEWRTYYLVRYRCQAVNGEQAEDDHDVRLLEMAESLERRGKSPTLPN